MGIWEDSRYRMAAVLDPQDQAPSAAAILVVAPAVASDNDADADEEDLGEMSPNMSDTQPKKRKGKSTRWNIPKIALTTLEQVFTRDKFPTVDTRKNLASELKVTPRQVQVWFQNKRQRSLKPPVKPGSAEPPPQQILSISEDIKAALINFGSNSVEATRAQREVFAEDGMNTSLVKLATHASSSATGQSESWISGASGQAAAAAASATMDEPASNSASSNPSMEQHSSMSNWLSRGNVTAPFHPSCFRQGSQWHPFLSGSSGGSSGDTAGSSSSAVPPSFASMAGLPPSFAAQFLPLGNSISPQSLAQQLASSGTSADSEYPQQRASQDGARSLSPTQNNGGAQQGPSLSGKTCDGARDASLLQADNAASFSSFIGSSPVDAFALPPSMPTGRSLNSSQAMENGRNTLSSSLVSEAVLAAAAAAYTPMPSTNAHATSSLPDGVPNVLAQHWQQMLMMRQSNWPMQSSSSYDGHGAPGEGSCSGNGGNNGRCSKREASSQPSSSQSGQVPLHAMAASSGGSSSNSMPTSASSQSNGGQWHSREQMLMQELMAANMSCSQAASSTTYAHMPQVQNGDELMEQLIDSLFTDELANSVAARTHSTKDQVKLDMPLSAQGFSSPSPTAPGSLSDSNTPAARSPPQSPPEALEAGKISSCSSPTSRSSESRLCANDLLQMGADLLDDT